MLIIDSKDCENIDKALKKYKKKFEKSKTLLQLRERQSFTKPSVKRRGEVLKAIYRQQIATGLLMAAFSVVLSILSYKYLETRFFVRSVEAQKKLPVT